MQPPQAADRPNGANTGSSSPPADAKRSPLRLLTPFADQLLGRRVNPLSAGRFQAGHDAQTPACSPAGKEWLPGGGGPHPPESWPQAPNPPSRLLFFGIRSA